MRNTWDPIGSVGLLTGSGRLPRQTGKMAPGNQAPAGRRQSARKHVNRCIRGGNSGSTTTARQRAPHLQARWVPHWTLGANATGLAVASVCSRRGRRSVQHLAQRGYSHPRRRARWKKPGGADTARQPDLGNPAGGTQIAGGVGQLRRVPVLSYGDPPSETFSGRQRNSRLERCIGSATIASAPESTSGPVSGCPAPGFEASGQWGTGRCHCLSMLVSGKYTEGWNRSK